MGSFKYSTLDCPDGGRCQRRTRKAHEGVGRKKRGESRVVLSSGLRRAVAWRGILAWVMGRKATTGGVGRFYQTQQYWLKCPAYFQLLTTRCFLFRVCKKRLQYHSIPFNKYGV